LIARLEPGEGVTFSGSYPIPPDVCSVSDTVTAAGVDLCLHTVTTNASAICPIFTTPSIALTMSCHPSLIEPGQLLTVTGGVTNIGNITLTNVTVTNVIAAISTNRLIVGPITLAPGAGVAFTDSYTVPLDSCGPYRDTVFAAGADQCFGRVVTASDFKDCPATNSPAIIVSKSCPAGLIQPGEILTITGTVTNIGNITLTNVTVTNTIVALGNLTRRILGPLTLPPGEGSSFTDNYVVPLDSCGPYR